MLRWNETGLAQAGDMQGFYVRAVQDSGDTGGCYLLFSRNFDQPNAEGYDEWYLKPKELEHRIAELDIAWGFSHENENHS